MDSCAKDFHSLSGPFLRSVSDYTQHHAAKPWQRFPDAKVAPMEACQNLADQEPNSEKVPRACGFGSCRAGVVAFDRSYASFACDLWRALTCSTKATCEDGWNYKFEGPVPRGFWFRYWDSLLGEAPTSTSWSAVLLIIVGTTITISQKQQLFRNCSDCNLSGHTRPCACNMIMTHCYRHRVASTMIRTPIDILVDLEVDTDVYRDPHHQQRLTLLPRPSSSSRPSQDRHHRAP